MGKSMGVVDVRRVRMLVTPISVWFGCRQDKNTAVFTLKTQKSSTRRVISIFLDDSFKIQWMTQDVLSL